jgi:hypothetical protein
VSIRTRGGTSTHTNLVIEPDGDLICANTALNGGSEVSIDGVAYPL